MKTTRERLIAAGLELVHAHSYGAVSVDDICKRADVHKGSFYHCFASKSDLAVAILDEQEAIYRAEVMRPAFGGDLPPLEKIAEAFRLFGAFHKRVKARRGRTLGCPFGNLALELASDDKKVRDRVRAGLDQLAQSFGGALRQAMECGDLPKEAQGDPDLGGQQLAAYLQGLVLWAKVNDDPSRIAAPPGFGLEMRKAGARAGRRRAVTTRRQ